MTVFNQKLISGPSENPPRKEVRTKLAGEKKFTVKIITRGAVVRLAIFAGLLVIFCLGGYFVMIKMPGKSYTDPLLSLTDAQKSLRNELARDVEKLAGEIGERNIWQYQNLAAAAEFIKASLSGTDYHVNQQNYQVEGKTCSNIEAEITGTKNPEQLIIIGAHYDSVCGSPGANDNASAVAALLALVRRFAEKKPARTLRFVFFVNEEPPFFRTDQMGSLVYTKSCRRKGENIVAMLCFETIGYYTEQPNSQEYPFSFSLIYPSTGNFLGFVSNLSSRKLLRRVIGSFRRNCKFPSQGGAIPEIVPGINWSDQWSFWQEGYPAIMVTDTAPFRYPYYHTSEDTPDKVNYDHLTRVVSGFQAVIAELAGLTD